LYIYDYKGGEKVANTLGGWAFLVGVLLALVFAFYPFAGLAWLLVVLGIVIGLLNITEKETQKFLWASVVLVVVGAFAGASLESVPYLPELFTNLVGLFAPAAVVVALKSVFEMAKTK